MSVDLRWHLAQHIGMSTATVPSTAQYQTKLVAAWSYAAALSESIAKVFSEGASASDG